MCGLAVGAGVPASAVESNSGRYLSISDRNIFGLRPPPPVEEAQPPAPPPALVSLNGITTIFGDKRAVLALAQQPPQPGARETTYILAEGQREGPLQVLEVDEKAGAVKISLSGAVTTLTFALNGPKTPAPPAQSGPPAGPAPRLPVHTSAPAPAPKAAAMSVEEQTVLLELQREATKNDPNAPPLPPTALTPALSRTATSP